MKHVGVRSNAKDIVSQEQLSNATDSTKLPLAGGQMTGPLNEAYGTASIVSGALTFGANGNSAFVGGSAGQSISTISDASVSAAGPFRVVVFVSPGMVLRHSNNLVLPTQADITVLNGDAIILKADGPNNWRVISYMRADGTALVAAAGPASTDGLSEGTTNLYFTQTRVRSTPVTGLSLADKTSVVAADTVLAAIGKLQAQITNNAFRVETISTASVGQTSYAVPNGYTVGAVIVFFNGALLAPADYTATDGANVVLASGSLTTSDIMSVIVIAAIRTQDDALLQYTVAALPAASANLAKQRWCTNMAGGAGVVVSNGTNWLRVADNTIVTV